MIYNVYIPWIFLMLKLHLWFSKKIFTAKSMLKVMLKAKMNMELNWNTWTKCYCFDHFGSFADRYQSPNNSFIYFCDITSLMGIHFHTQSQNKTVWCSPYIINRCYSEIPCVFYVWLSKPLPKDKKNCKLLFGLSLGIFESENKILYRKYLHRDLLLQLFFC